MFPQLTTEPDPDTVFGRVALRSRRVPPWLRAVLALPAIALLIFFIATDSGPYGLLAEWQASFMDGEHYPLLSGGITFLLVMLPAAIAFQLLGAYTFKPKVVAPPPGYGGYPMYPGQEQGYPPPPGWQPPPPVHYTPPGQSPQPGQSPPPGWQSLQGGQGRPPQ